MRLPRAHDVAEALLLAARQGEVPAEEPEPEPPPQAPPPPPPPETPTHLRARYVQGLLGVREAGHAQGDVDLYLGHGVLLEEGLDSGVVWLPTPYHAEWCARLGLLGALEEVLGVGLEVVVGDVDRGRRRATG